MAFTGMSAGNPYSVRTFPEGAQDKFRAHSSGARYSYHPHIGRVLHSAYACKIGGTIAAPVAQKTDDLCLFVAHSLSLLSY
jgi:hypothetical protein